eukprot:633803-Pelagomonas_calceolata.AAC.3
MTPLGCKRHDALDSTIACHDAHARMHHQHSIAACIAVYIVACTAVCIAARIAACIAVRIAAPIAACIAACIAVCILHNDCCMHPTL